MTCKRLVLPLALTSLLLSGYALADDPVAASDEALEQCQQIAQMTPMDIFSRTQSGVSQSYDELAQSCFKQNACSSMTDVDKPTCAHSLALNSYLIDVAYKTHGPAYPPYSSNLPILKTTQPSNSSAPQSEAPPIYNNLASPSATIDTPAKAEQQETINWS